MFIILYPENVFIMFTKFRKIVEDGRLARVLEATNSNHYEICIICIYLLYGCVYFVGFPKRCAADFFQNMRSVIGFLPRGKRIAKVLPALKVTEVFFMFSIVSYSFRCFLLISGAFQCLSLCV